MTTKLEHRIAYKVVVKNANRLMSCMAPDFLAVEYKLDEWTETNPKLAEAQQYLVAFDTLATAKSFVHTLGFYQFCFGMPQLELCIFKCEVELADEKSVRLNVPELCKTVKAYIKAIKFERKVRIKTKTRPVGWAKGTLFCTRIKLEKCLCGFYSLEKL